ncbi:chromosome segregation protein SMC [Denitrovibrio acetiphilus DSM 12809]|uniref:Chromosome partition protein Smc n=1 Tax=Denitrovibrio acetiphilus (strain DSM 12809 / NBRC 114555 / N2460) TaxID=522772 RepID=D4H2V6_DENA2|nr:AAA family ATPase [Denitrovibrio acetiphilus]ADD68979.1 chromosome segregation protein SMC [Denitrovibrio acetiphilus DSM 12809]
MKFKSLVVQGFKSFVDKTVIEFPGGITCVIGPNGSGKSNILDAIRWIFGEQSAKELRGADMDDVIFAGSQHRKPTGFAEVSLTLSELPESLTAKWGSFSEITVSRKHYRTGDREYRINGKKCRLKDIREIFYDSGIGARSISIIEQGKVEKIIQSTPEDLRAFFEETAGVMRFKERKKEAERRLYQTKDNLSRVTDIIAEIRAQMETLSVQTDRVKRYRELSAKQSALSKSVIFHRYSKSFSDLKEITETVNQLKIDLSGYTEKFTKLTNIETEISSKLSTSRKEYNSKNELILQAESESGKTEADIRLLENEIEAAEKSKDSLHGDIEFLQKKLNELTERRVNVLESKSEQTEKLKETEEKIDEFNERIADYETMREDIKEEMFALDDQYLELAQRASDTRNAIFENETLLTRSEKDKERLRNEKEESEKDSQFARKNIEDQSSDVDRLTLELETIAETLEHYSDEHSELRDEISVIETELSDKQIEVKSINSRIKMLTQSLDAESASDDIKQILEATGGTLLLPKLTEELTRELGDLIIIPENVKTDIAEILRDVKQSVRFVYENDVDALIDYAENNIDAGENIVRNGFIHRKPGADDKRENVIRLKKQIEGYETELTKAQKDCEELEQSLPELTEKLELLADKKDELLEQKQTTTLDLKDRERSLNDLKSRHERLSKRSSIIDSEIQNIDSEIEQAKEKIEYLKEQNKELSVSIAAKEEEKDAMQSKLEDIDNMYEDVRDELSAYRVEMRGIQEKMNAVTNELHFIDRDLDESSTKLTAAKNRLSKLVTSDIVTLKDNLEKKRIDYQNVIKKRQSLNDEKLRLDHQIAEMEKQLEDFGRDIDKMNLHIKSIEDDIFDAEKKMERYQTEVSAQTEAFLEKFNDDITSFEMDLTDFQPNKAKNELSTIERDIESLGPLNMAAENEYQEVVERNEFLSAQKEDLEGAVTSIYELIREMDENTSALFLETFEGVKKNFSRVFSILFGNGNCDLKLSDPDDILHSGVEIFVQPPGKKLQNMNLLSGGEKAMSACTLLFALFLYRPTPFCFLDEIDAPLDDNNVERFTKIVKTLSADTQFVIISHNQKTMAEADSIYGVTMQEPGVSRILSVTI